MSTNRTKPRKTRKGHVGFRVFRVFVFSWLTIAAVGASAQSRIAILQAEDRRAATPNDLAVLRAGSRAEDEQTRRMAIRALGRLEQPSLISDLVSGLRNSLPEIRAEAANAIGQAAQGWKTERTPAEARAFTSALSTLTSRLRVEADPDVRAALCETIGRLPFAAATDVEQAERVLIAASTSATTITDRLGVAKGFESLVRVAQRIQPPSADAIGVLRRLATGGGDNGSGARIRRLAFVALVTANAADGDTLHTAASDPDAQVRREAMRAAALPGRERLDGDGEITRTGLNDPMAMVRFEALRGRRGDCDAAIAATRDGDMHVVLLGLDQLAACGASADAVELLERTLDDPSEAGSARGWHRAAHALVSLAGAQPERGAAKLLPFATSRVWQLRMYAARAAAVLKDRATLEKLATSDDDDNVREAALDALTKLADHDADAIYIANLSRPGYQAIRAAALALVGSADPNAAPALDAALQRLVNEGRDNSHDARAAILKAQNRSDRLVRLNGQTKQSDLSAEELRRLASPRARIAIRGVGTFELALFTNVAPLTVLKFAHLAETGYYNGLTFHRVVPNFVIQGGSPGANEYIGDARFMRDEVALWPHVRGAVGISTRGHDTGDAQIFVDLVDNPRLDHVYTVFAQVLNGMDIVDRILEGDVIERIDIIP
jgi:cyclophilin family peptidyl-prolyl cis-trans isomerase/HEAT repeat protein